MNSPNQDQETPLRSSADRHRPFLAINNTIVQVDQIAAKRLFNLQRNHAVPRYVPEVL